MPDSEDISPTTCTTNVPSPALSVLDAVAVIVGIVVGVGIFRTPAVVAAHVTNELGFVLVWILGGCMSLIGALCYAELATAYPHVGGEYHYLARAFGQTVAFLFAWARLTVMQTGSIVLLAFIFGDYLSYILPLGSTDASACYAALVVIGLTALNAIGFRVSTWIQNGLTIVKILGLVSVIAVGLFYTSPLPVASLLPLFQETPFSSVFSLVGSLFQNIDGQSMIFVLLTYGGWSEAAYLSAEVREGARNMVRVLVTSIGLITGLFVLTNIAYLHSLGLPTIAQSEVVAAELMHRTLGQNGVHLITGLIAISALGSMQGSILTGARATQALEQALPWKGPGGWQIQDNPSLVALLVQGAIALLLVGLGTYTRQGFETLVNYTAPVFWGFLCLTGLSLFVLRQRDPTTPRPFPVPLYPFTPLLFCLICLSMLYASLVATGVGAIVGVMVVLAGLPLIGFSRLLKTADDAPGEQNEPESSSP